MNYTSRPREDLTFPSFCFPLTFSPTPSSPTVERGYADHEHEQAAADQHQGIVVLPGAQQEKDLLGSGGRDLLPWHL